MMSFHKIRLIMLNDMSFKLLKYNHIQDHISLYPFSFHHIMFFLLTKIENKLLAQGSTISKNIYKKYVDLR